MLKDKKMVCPRCDCDRCTMITQSPISGCWEVYGCPRCFFVWRSTEPDTITDGRKYDARFKLDEEKIGRFHNVPEIPPLLAQ
ncbi:MAG TPA: non-oxidative hydroxyarylic acid decarboxylases subunit D [Ktedonobacteraceae bacterium]